MHAQSHRPVTLLDDERLAQSGVVANCRMNRERVLVGSNGYDHELGFNPFEMLLARLESQQSARWLDLCCGQGRALIEAAELAHAHDLGDRVEIVGVDLAGMFAPRPRYLQGLRFFQASLTDWRPERAFDLITCIHGLHYIGDKLGLLARAASWLTADGVFTANLGLENFRDGRGQPSGRSVAAELRRAGFEYNTRTRRVRCVGHRQVEWPFRYLGADDGAGPNYTGQPAIHSCYERAT
ncbi:MAG TPA: class I SAM-dependent methyltransferase [Planctomycetaceae bacterium]|nr:class I SAM-dependent methyltransferase [Planctomycetaceae bacterium]